MFQTGSQINPALGRIDYSTYAQGAIAGGQAIGQGIANLGQGIASGIEQYAKQKKENKQLEAKLKGSIASLEGLGQIAKGVSPEADSSYTGLMAKLNDPSISTAEKVALSDSAQGTLKELISFGIQAKNNVDQDRSAQAGLFFSGSGSGPVLPANRAAVLQSLGFTPQQIAAGQAYALNLQAKQADIDKTNAEIDKAKLAKPTKQVWTTPAEAAAFGQSQLGPNSPLIAVPVSDEGGYVVSFQKRPEVPDLVTPAVVSAQIPMIQASFNAAEAVPLAIENIHQQKDLINSSEVPTGILAPVETFVNKIGALLGVKSYEAAAARTAAYDKLLNQATYDAMKASGLKATQLNTEKEWERFNKAMAAARENPKDAALAILDLNEKAQRAVLAEHNKKKQSGSYKRFLESSMVDYPEIPMPPEYSANKSAGTIDVGGKRIPSANSFFGQPAK